MELATQTLPPPDAIDERLRALYRAASPTEKPSAVARINAALTAIEAAAMAGQPTVERITFLIAAAHISRLDLEEWPAASPHRGLAQI